MGHEKKRASALIECRQEIPCNPCTAVCRTGAITKESLCSCPVLHAEKCVGCGLCVAACPGQAIFLQLADAAPGLSTITFPYEYLPLPTAGQTVTATDRMGQALCEALVLSVEQKPLYNKTALVTLQIPAELRDEIRFMKRLPKEALRHG